MPAPKCRIHFFDADEQGRYPEITGTVKRMDTGDAVATVRHEGISFTVRMVTPYAGVSRGFAQVRAIEAWVRKILKHYGVEAKAKMPIRRLAGGS